MSHKPGFAGPVAFAAIGLLVLLPLFYILSAGPVIGLMSRGYILERATVVVYSPLNFVCENCTPLGDGMNWYVGLFLPADEFEVPTDVDVYQVPSATQPAGATTRQPPPIY